MEIKEKTCLNVINVILHDKDGKFLMGIDGFGGKAYIDGELIYIYIDKMVRQIPYYNGEGDGTFNSIRFEEGEIDFSNIPDEEWLKLKNIKKISFETM